VGARVLLSRASRRRLSTSPISHQSSWLQREGTWIAACLDRPRFLIGGAGGRWTAGMGIGGGVVLREKT